MSLDLEELPHGGEIFDQLRRGIHIDESEPKLHWALSEHFTEFHELFDYLGFQLREHDRNFFYFRSDSASGGPGKRARRISVFFFVFVDELSSRGEDAVEVLFRPQGHRVGELPHLERAQHRECLAAVGVDTEGDLKDLIRSMARYNFVDRLGDGQFRIRKPAWRFVELCYEFVDDSKE